ATRTTTRGRWRKPGRRWRGGTSRSRPPRSTSAGTRCATSGSIDLALGALLFSSAAQATDDDPRVPAVVGPARADSRAAAAGGVQKLYGSLRQHVEASTEAVVADDRRIDESHGSSAAGRERVHPTQQPVPDGGQADHLVDASEETALAVAA